MEIAHQKLALAVRMPTPGTLLVLGILMMAGVVSFPRHVRAAQNSPAGGTAPAETLPERKTAQIQSPADNPPESQAPNSSISTPAQPTPQQSPSSQFNHSLNHAHTRRASSTDTQAPLQALLQTPSQPAPETVAAETKAKLDQTQLELDAALDQIKQSHENLAGAGTTERRTLIACAILLAVFAVFAIAALILVYLQARSWNKRSSESVLKVEAIASELAQLGDARTEIRSALPRLLQEVGDQPLSFEEEGVPFPGKSLAVLDDIDHLAYLGDARLSFSGLSSPQQTAVYLNGLLLSAVAHLARSDPWTSFLRLDQFFELLARHPQAVDHHRTAQAYSYRALAAYRVLDAQDAEPSWQRRSERSQTEVLSKQAFADITQASHLDPEWSHATFVEALLSSRFYTPDDPAENGSRMELHVRGLRRAIALYKKLIEQKSYRGPARRNLARCLKQIAEQTGEKSDFSDFGFMLSSFPTDEELADEALAARQPASQDRFLWQWLLGDEELFRSVDRLNLAEYRSFWIRLLDNKVHLRNWRADLGEMQQRNPAMRDWSVQLLHAEAPISLANAISRRQERFEAPPSGT